MDKNLKNSVALFVDRIGYQEASDIAFSKIADNINLCTGHNSPLNDIPGYMVGRLKFYVSVIEYLYCDEEEIDAYCTSESML